MYCQRSLLIPAISHRQPPLSRAVRIPLGIDRKHLYISGGAATWWIHQKYFSIFSSLLACVYQLLSDSHHPHNTQMVSMGTTNNKQPQAVFYKITSSLFKLANTGRWNFVRTYISLFPWQPSTKIPSVTFPYNYFFTSQTCKPCNAWSWNLVRMCIWAFPWQPLTKNCLRHFFL